MMNRRMEMDARVKPGHDEKEKAFAAVARRLSAAAVLGAALLVGSCAEPPTDRLTLTPVAFTDLPGWRDDAVAEALPALLRSCALLANRAPDRAVGRDGVGGTVADWLPACGAARRVPAGDDQAARAYFETWFQPYAAGSDGLFTGYYESELNGALEPDARYRYPIHGRPADLVTVDLDAFLPDAKLPDLVGRVAGGKVVPYPRRAEIDGGALGAAAPVVAWADDPVDVLLLHIQGSGRLNLPDGRTLRVGYAASNGHKFVGITRTLLDHGKLGRNQATMQDTAAWLRANPEQAAALIQENPRYIFFRLFEGDGPLGAQGVPLTPLRSMAVDPAHVPLGVPLWLDTRDPDGRPLRRLMLAQDTGSAIKGPVRGDFFWGHGDEAFHNAGRMKSRGTYYLLLPAAKASRLAQTDGGLASAAAARQSVAR